MLKLNDDKTELIIFGTHQQLKKIDHITIKTGNENIVPIEHVRNLGFFMDKLCKNTMHINKLSLHYVISLRTSRKLEENLILRQPKQWFRP